MVIWLVGLSGSGKTTLGKKLKDYFLDNNIATILIDGDEVRSFFNSDLGYSTKDREENIKRIQLAAYFLSKTEVVTIVCNISPFEKLREFSRSKINNYIQIYLKRDFEICRELDVKNIYDENTGITEIVGHDILFDEPINSDLVCNTHTESVDESLERIKKMIETKIVDMDNEINV